YTSASGGETFTVNGVKSTSGLSLKGSTVTVAASALNGSNVSISNGYKLALASGIASPSTTPESWSINGNVATYKASSTSAGYSVVYGQIVYTSASGGETFTVNGVKSTSGLSLKGSTVTVAVSALNNSNVSISNGYKLALASGIASPSTTAESWTINGNVATYKAASTSAGYSVVNGQIVYTSASGGESFTVNGVKSTDGLTLNGSTVTVAASALNGSNVTISNGYKLALASGIASPSTTAAAWSLSGNVATYKASSTSAGYNVVNNQIVYTPASGGESFTVSGVKSTDGLSLNGSTVTVAASALNQSNVTISNSNYKLALANGIASPSTTAESWTINGTTATFKSTSNTAGYNLVNGQIVYSAKKTATTLATVTGLKSGLKVTNGNINGITVNGNTITLAASVLGKTTVEVSGDYKLALAANVNNPTTKEGAWTLNGTTATYKGSSSTAGYTIAGDGKSVLYSAATTAATLSTIKGIKTTSGISISDNFVNLKASMLNAKVTVSGEYGFNFAAGNYSKKIITGSKVADNIISNGKNLSINTGAGADSIKVTGNATSVTGGTGNDTIVNSGDNNIFIYAAGDGKDIIYGFDNTSKLKIGNGKGIYSSKTEGNDVIVTVGDGKITLVDAVKLDTVNILGKADVPAKNIDSAKNNVTINGTDYDDTIKSSGQYVKILSGAGHDSINVSGSNVTVNGATGDDTIVSSGKYVSINAGAGDNYVELTDKSTRQTVTSNAGDDYILNAGKNVSISTGAGNDTIITSGASVSIRGGNGSDVFTFNGGGGIINDYAAEDIIRFTKGAAKVTTSGQNIIFTVGSNKVTVKGGKGKLITYYDTKGEHTYPTSVELSGSTATLLKNYSKDSFNVADYGTYNTINASAVTHDLSITANKNANRIIGSEENDYIEGLAGKDTILGGDGNDTILGGAGNDSLSGGKGSDVFVYSKGSGNDIITDYTNEDMIQIVDAKPAIKTSGNDVVFTVGSGKITVKNSAKKIIAYTDSTGNPQTYFNTLVVNGTTATLTEMYTEKTYTAGAKIVTVDAADVNHNLKIMGNAKANDILGGSGNDSINGGAGKDTIHGGAGKDTILGGTGDDLLFGGEGADLFVYGNGGGKDVIGDYREEDKIKITSGTISKATADGNDVVYKIGSGSITVLDGVGKNISFVNSNGKAIKPPTITINANVPYWFIQDDDAFTTAQLDSIVETSEAYSFDEMQPSDSLTQENILVSYSDKK
ncbi:MAG: hypothetical protein IJL14_03720, partial [Selenomonadaceae bacterium]|nr:hypothetical protein [Selenomonadaceae bacterium]